MDKTFEGLVEMFEGDSADTRTRKLPLMSMEGRAEGPVCADYIMASSYSITFIMPAGQSLDFTLLSGNTAKRRIIDVRPTKSVR